MYSFQTGAGRRKAQKTVRILSVVVFVLAIALIGVTVSYLHASGVSRSTSDALMARATNEANEAQTAVYRLTQSSGTNTMTRFPTSAATFTRCNASTRWPPTSTAREPSSSMAPCSPPASPRWIPRAAPAGR